MAHVLDTNHTKSCGSNENNLNLTNDTFAARAFPTSLKVYMKCTIVVLHFCYSVRERKKIQIFFIKFRRSSRTNISNKINQMTKLNILPRA